jgi:hypothetical protein
MIDLLTETEPGCPAMRQDGVELWPGPSAASVPS